MPDSDGLEPVLDGMLGASAMPSALVMDQPRNYGSLCENRSRPARNTVKSDCQDLIAFFQSEFELQVGSRPDGPAQEGNLPEHLGVFETLSQVHEGRGMSIDPSPFLPSLPIIETVVASFVPSPQSTWTRNGDGGHELVEAPSLGAEWAGNAGHSMEPPQNFALCSRITHCFGLRFTTQVP